MPATCLLVTSGFTKFRYVATVASGTEKGELRLKTLPKDPIVIDFDGSTYRIDFERTRDGFVVDGFRFTLRDAAGKPMASGEKVAGKRAFTVALDDAPYRFEKRGGLFSLRFVLLDANGTALGALAETTGFSLWKRRFRFDLPDGIDGATGLFLFFLVVNLHFR